MARDPGMQDAARESRLFKTIVILAIVLIVVRAVATGQAPLDTLTVSDNDDIMRYLMVTEWLAGQPWYDTTQYRMLPPEGLDLHWSRYVDLGMAAIIWPLTLFMSPEAATQVALVAWPTVLFVALVALTGLAARRMFGNMAGLISVVAVLLWPPTGLTYFAPARIDHHNVQILLTTVMMITVIWPGPSRWLGVLGGLAAGLSLAIGLETVITIALTGLVLVARVLVLRPGVAGQLSGFAGALAVVATLLFLGQTAPEAWLEAKCDELSLPYLALAWMGAGICLVTAALAHVMGNTALRVAGFVGLAVAGLAVLSPLIGPCASGPYDSLPQEVQDLITGRIIEARPAFAYLWDAKALGFRFVVPAAMAVILGALVARWQTRRGGADRDVIARLWVLVLVAALGVIGGAFQIRLVLMGAAAIPMLMGVTIALLLAAGQRGDFGRLGALPAGLAALVTLMAPTVQSAWQSVPAQTAGGGAVQAGAVVDADACRTPALLRSLNTVPEGVVLSSSSYGPPILLLTHHSVLAGPYHRSADAIVNGAVPFDGDEQALRTALARTGAEYLLLCRDAQYGDGTSFATALAAGVQADGLTPVEGPAEALILLQVAQETPEG